jgi:uncharacterized paraquat-inducible protein A
MIIECEICYTTPEKQTFVDCGNCTNKICTDCFSKLQNLKCPYCRHRYHTQNDNFEHREVILNIYELLLQMSTNTSIRQICIAGILSLFIGMCIGFLIGTFIGFHFITFTFYKLPIFIITTILRRIQ